MSKYKFFAPLPPGICGPAPGYKAATAVTTQDSGTQHNLTSAWKQTSETDIYNWERRGERQGRKLMEKEFQSSL